MSTGKPVRIRTMSDPASPRALRNLVVVPRRDLSLDFANTVIWRGSAREDSLHSLSDLLKWLTSSGTVSARSAAELQNWFDGHPVIAASVFADAIELRETLYRLLRSVAIGSAPATDDLRHLNRALGKAAQRSNLDHADSRFGWRIDAKPTAASLLTPALWSAADILVGPEPARLRECANDRCLWLFLDDSKNGTRRWCSMQSCGNRAKAHRHYLRQKKQ